MKPTPVKRILIVVAVLLALLLLMWGTAQAQAVQVTDDRGRVVQLPRAPQRIVREGPLGQVEGGGRRVGRVRRHVAQDHGRAHRRGEQHREGHERAAHPVDPLGPGGVDLRAEPEILRAEDLVLTVQHLGPGEGRLTVVAVRRAHGLTLPFRRPRWKGLSPPRARARGVNRTPAAPSPSPRAWR